MAQIGKLSRKRKKIDLLLKSIIVCKFNQSFPKQPDMCGIEIEPSLLYTTTFFRKLHIFLFKMVAVSQRYSHVPASSHLDLRISIPTLLLNILFRYAFIYHIVNLFKFSKNFYKFLIFKNHLYIIYNCITKFKSLSFLY